MVYVTSDLHGYPLKRFLKFLKMAGFTDSDFLVILGDVIDRGSDGARILEWITEQDNVELILGNHELMMLECEFVFNEISEKNLDDLSYDDLKALRRWKHNGAEETLEGLRKLGRKTTERILEYLKGCAFYEDVEIGGKRFVLTHGGLGGYEKEKKIEDYEPYDLVWHRPTLDEEYAEDMTVVIGHTPTEYYGEEFKGRMIKTKSWINIDTGVAFGNEPMLLRLDDMKAFYIE